jgi:hypothetical protein
MDSKKPIFIPLKTGNQKINLQTVWTSEGLRRTGGKLAWKFLFELPHFIRVRSLPAGQQRLNKFDI